MAFSYIRNPAHGPLPLILLLLTTMTGVIDAVSILALGRVFVANMTGNVVFLGFAIAGAPGFDLAPSLAALIGFLAGAYVGGTFVARLAGNRGILLRDALLAEFMLVGIALVIVAASSTDLSLTVKIVVAALSAIAMGVQNTIARKLAVPDLTTTVLTMTITGIAADLRGHQVGRTDALIRRLLAVATMFLGAVAGALLVLHAGVGWGLALVVSILGTAALITWWSTRVPAPWQTHGVQ